MCQKHRAKTQNTIFKVKKNWNCKATIIEILVKFIILIITYTYIVLKVKNLTRNS